MGRNYLTFLVVLVILLLFSLGVAYAAIYMGGGVALGIIALVGLLVCLVGALIIALEAREEFGMLGLSFFVVVGITGVLIVWFLTRSGVSLSVW
jgi:hypothetical protein